MAYIAVFVGGKWDNLLCAEKGYLVFYQIGQIIIKCQMTQLVLK